MTRLRRDVEDVEQPVGRERAAADRVRRIDAHRQPRQALDHRHVREVDEVAVRIAEVGLHAAQAEDDAMVAARGDVLAGVERLLERDAHAALEQHRHLVLRADRLEQLEVLRVARADLQHHAGGVSRRCERAADLVDVRLARHLHGDDADAVLAGELEELRQAGGAVALEIVRAGARLVGAGARGDDAVLGERAEGRLDVLAGVDGAQPGEDVQRVLREADAVVLEAERLELAAVAADGAVLLGDAHDLLDRFELLERRRRQRVRRRRGGRPR